MWNIRVLIETDDESAVRSIVDEPKTDNLTGAGTGGLLHRPLTTRACPWCISLKGFWLRASRSVGLP